MSLVALRMNRVCPQIQFISFYLDDCPVEICACLCSNSNAFSNLLAHQLHAVFYRHHLTSQGHNTVQYTCHVRGGLGQSLAMKDIAFAAQIIVQNCSVPDQALAYYGLNGGVQAQETADQTLSSGQ